MDSSSILRPILGKTPGKTSTGSHSTEAQGGMVIPPSHPSFCMPSSRRVRFPPGSLAGPLTSLQALYSEPPRKKRERHFPSWDLTVFRLSTGEGGEYICSETSRPTTTGCSSGWGGFPLPSSSQGFGRFASRFDEVMRQRVKTMSHRI